jgi:pimeloyl-ACP methyl ester carboxylesterase
LVRRAAIAAGAIGGAAGAAYVAQRIAAGRVRRVPDADAHRTLEEPIYIDHTLESHDGGTIYVAEAGDAEAPPIVLSHGVTLSARVWFYQLEQLPKAGLRAIAFDHRGHGQSVLGTGGHSLENIAEDLKTVVEQLDLRDAILVGHSMGGVAVQKFLIKYPELAAERVAGVVLLSTLAYTPLGSRSTQTKAKLERLTKRTPDTQFIWERPNFGFLLARLGFGKRPRPSHVELVRRMMAECPADTRQNAPRTLVGLDLTPDLPKIKMPTLVIGGTADMLTPLSEAKRIVKLIPGARLEVLPDGGHMLMLERAEALSRLIVDFAREARSRRHSAA